MNPDTCLQHLEMLAARWPGYPDSWYNLGLLLAHMGRSAQALDAIERALQIHTEYADAFVGRCFLLGEVGRQDEGFRAFRRLHVKGPDDFNTLFALGIYCMRHGWKDTGLAQLVRAEAMRPKTPYVLLTVAEALQEFGEVTAAQERIETARAIVHDFDIASLQPEAASATQPIPAQRWRNPCLSKAHVLLANFASAKGDAREAERELFLGCLSYPGHSKLMTHVGKILHIHERYEEAERWLVTATRLDPSCNQAFFELGFVHAGKGRWEQALQALQTAVKLRPLYPDYHYHLGLLLDGLGRTREAVAEFERAVTIHPTFGHAAIRLASARLARREPELALQALGSNACGNWPEAMVLRAEAHLQDGHPTEARALLEKVLAGDEGCAEATAMLRAVREGGG